MFISIVIPTFNRAPLLRGLLDSLTALQVPEGCEWEILVIDNNSNDSTREIVDEAIHKKVLPLRYFLERQQGASYARNKGVREAAGDIIAFLDDDEIVDPFWLRAICGGFEKYACAGVGGKVVARWTFPIPSWYTTEGPFRIVGPTAEHDLGDTHREYSIGDHLPVTANFAVRTENFLKYGYFRTNMGPVGNSYIMGEDTEFCIRLMKGKEKLVYSPEAITYNVVHRERVTKKYCKRYHFLFGRIKAHLYEPQKEARMYANIPRHLFREYAETLLSWTAVQVSRNGEASFYYRLQLSRVSGQIFEHFMKQRRQSSIDPHN